VRRNGVSHPFFYHSDTDFIKCALASIQRKSNGRSVIVREPRVFELSLQKYGGDNSHLPSGFFYEFTGGLDGPSGGDDILCDAYALTSNPFRIEPVQNKGLFPETRDAFDGDRNWADHVFFQGLANDHVVGEI